MTYKYVENDSELSKLWQNKDKITLSSFPKNRIKKIFTNIKSIKAIQCSPTNSYNYIDQYMDIILMELEKRPKAVCLFAAGPRGKVLMHKLIDKGYVCYDLGHYIDGKLKTRQLFFKQI